MMQLELEAKRESTRRRVEEARRAAKERVEEEAKRRWARHRSQKAAGGAALAHA
jgi:hypothetical protein